MTNPGLTCCAALAGGLDATGPVQAAAFPAVTGGPAGSGHGGGPGKESPDGNSAVLEEGTSGVRLGLLGRAAG